MILLAVIFVFGLALGLLPWRLAAVCLTLAACCALAAYLFGIFSHPGSQGMFGATALLQGWACTLLIQRTIAERAV